MGGPAARGASVTARARPLAVAGARDRRPGGGGPWRSRTFGDITRTRRSSVHASSRGSASSRKPRPIERQPRRRLASGAGNGTTIGGSRGGTFRDHPVERRRRQLRPALLRAARDRGGRHPAAQPRLQSLSELGHRRARGAPGPLRRTWPRGGPGAKAARQSARSRRGSWRWPAPAAVGAWLAHTSVDWLHLLPGVTGVALGSARCCCCAARRVREGAVAGPARRCAGGAPRPTALAAIGLATAGRASADSDRRALSTAPSEALAERPAEAAAEADRALRLDPEAVEAYYVKAAALARFGKARAPQARSPRQRVASRRTM